MQRMAFRGLFAIVFTMTAAQGCGKTDSEIGSYKEAVNGDACDTPGARGKAADGCNTCTCTDEGTWACTDVACNPNEPPREKPDPICTDGELKDNGDGCNTCQCINGAWACTMRDCDPTPECTPGEVRDDGCNTCSCSADGTWACTLKQCGDMCTPGATKVADDGCNQCSCGDDGQWSCTDMACENVCPPPSDLGPDLACTQVQVWATRPGAGVCCPYGTPCVAPADWETFYTAEECYASFP